MKLNECFHRNLCAATIFVLVYKNTSFSLILYLIVYIHTLRYKYVDITIIFHAKILIVLKYRNIINHKLPA